MVKRYLLMGIGIVFFGMSSVVYGADAEITLESSTTSSGFSVKDSSGNTLMRVRGDGKVGIGTTDPLLALEVKGDFLSRSTTADNVGSFNTINITSGAWWHLTHRGSSDNFEVHVRPSGGGDNTVPFVIPLVMTTSGNVGIGTTAPTHPLHMGSGAHVTSGGVWTDASSREFKENIETLTLDVAVNTFNNLKPVTFNYKADKSESYVGFIAEDVPDLVATQDRKGLAPMDITAVLTKVVQEQQKMLREQQEEMKLMSKKIEKLESTMNFDVKGL